MHIVDPTRQQELCTVCRQISNAEHYFGPVLAIEVEPISSKATKNYKVGDLTPKIEVNEKNWNLCGFVEGRGGHFICHMLRQNKVWETYDDLAADATQLHTSKEFRIFMIFYLCSGT